MAKNIQNEKHKCPRVSVIDRFSPIYRDAGCDIFLPWVLHRLNENQNPPYSTSRGRAVMVSLDVLCVVAHQVPQQIPPSGRKVPDTTGGTWHAEVSGIQRKTATALYCCCDASLSATPRAGGGGGL